MSDDASAWIGVVGSLAGAGVGGLIGAGIQRGAKRAQQRRDTNERAASILQSFDLACEKWDNWRYCRRPDQHSTPEERSKATAHLDELRSFARTARHHAQYLELAGDERAWRASDELAGFLETIPHETEAVWAIQDGQVKQARSQATLEDFRMEREKMIRALRP